MPVCLMGANVNGKPNFNAIAWFNMVNLEPMLVGLSSDSRHYTNRGIHENKTFSINIPSIDMAAATDYCGMCTGANVDKSELFEVFYGELKTAPMIQECPMNVECKLERIVPLPQAEFIIGEIVAVYTEQRYLTDGNPDIMKINPLVYEPEHSGYWTLAEQVGQAFEIGKTYKPKRK